MNRIFNNILCWFSVFLIQYTLVIIVYTQKSHYGLTYYSIMCVCVDTHMRQFLHQLQNSVESNSRISTICMLNQKYQNEIWRLINPYELISSTTSQIHVNYKG